MKVGNLLFIVLCVSCVHNIYKWFPWRYSSSFHLYGSFLGGFLSSQDEQKSDTVTLNTTSPRQDGRGITGKTIKDILILHKCLYFIPSWALLCVSYFLFVLYVCISISRTSVYWLATVPSFFVSPVPTLCPHNLSDSFLPFLLVILWKRKEKGRIVCKVRTQQAENFDEEVKSLVSAWRALHLCLSFSTRQEDNRRPPMTVGCSLDGWSLMAVSSNLHLMLWNEGEEGTAIIVSTVTFTTFWLRVAQEGFNRRSLITTLGNNSFHSVVPLWRPQLSGRLVQHEDSMKGRENPLGNKEIWESREMS